MRGGIGLEGGRSRRGGEGNKKRSGNNHIFKRQKVLVRELREEENQELPALWSSRKVTRTTT